MEKNTKILLGVIFLVVLVMLITNSNSPAPTSSISSSGTYAVTPTKVGTWAVSLGKVASATFKWMGVALAGLLGYKLVTSGAVDNLAQATTNLTGAASEVPSYLWIAIIVGAIILVMMLMSKKR